MSFKIGGQNFSFLPTKLSGKKRSTKPIFSDLVVNVEREQRTHIDTATSWRQMGGTPLTHAGRRPEYMQKIHNDKRAAQTLPASQIPQVSGPRLPRNTNHLTEASPVPMPNPQTVRGSRSTNGRADPTPVPPPQTAGSPRVLPNLPGSSSPWSRRPPSPPGAQTSTAPPPGNRDSPRVVGSTTLPTRNTTPTGRAPGTSSSIRPPHAPRTSSLPQSRPAPSPSRGHTAAASTPGHVQASPRTDDSTRNPKAQQTPHDRIATPTSRTSGTSPPHAHRSPRTPSPPQSQPAPSPSRGQTAAASTPGHRQGSPTKTSELLGVPAWVPPRRADSPKPPPSVRDVNATYPPSRTASRPQGSSLGRQASSHSRPMLPHYTAPGTPRTLHRSTSGVRLASPLAPPARAPTRSAMEMFGLPTPQASPEKGAAVVPTTPLLITRKDTSRDAAVSIRPERQATPVIKVQSPTNSESSVETKEADVPKAKFFTPERGATGSGFTLRRSPPLASGSGDARRLSDVGRSPSSDKEHGGSSSPVKTSGASPGSVPRQACLVRPLTPKTDAPSLRRPADASEKRSQRESRPALALSISAQEGTPSNASPLGGMPPMKNFKAQPMGASSTTLASTVAPTSTIAIPDPMMVMPASSVDGRGNNGGNGEMACPPTDKKNTQPRQAAASGATPRQAEDVEDDDGESSMFSSSTDSVLTESLNLPACLANRFDIRSACKLLYRAQCLFAEQAYPSRALFARILTAVEPYHPLSLARWDTLPHALDTRLLAALLRTLAAHPNKRAQRSFFPCVLLRVLSAYSETTALDVLTHVDAHMPRSKVCVGRREEYAPRAKGVVERLWGAIDAAVRGPLKRIALGRCRREECKDWVLRANTWGLREWLLFLLPEGPTARAAARAQMLSGMCAKCRHSGKEEWVVGREVVWRAFALDKARAEKDACDGASDTTCERGEDRGVMGAKEMRRLRRCEYMHTRYMWKKPSPQDEEDALEEVLDPGRMWTALVSDEGTPLYRRNPLALDTVSLIDD